MKSKMIKLDDFLTPREVVERWRGMICVGTLANWRSEGKGPPYVKFGRRVGYVLDGLRKHEKKNTITPRGK